MDASGLPWDVWNEILTTSSLRVCFRVSATCKQLLYRIRNHDFLHRRLRLDGISEHELTGYGLPELQQAAGDLASLGSDLNLTLMLDSLPRYRVDFLNIVWGSLSEATAICDFYLTQAVL
jgi:hypothetical protein